MEQIIITNNQTGQSKKLFTKEPFCTVKSAIQEKNLMGDDTIKLSIVSSQLLNFGKGDYITIDGEVYTVRTPATRQIISDNYYQYDVTLYGVMYELMKCLYRNTDANGRSSKSSFDLTYSLKDFAKVIINNMNRDYPGKWVLDEANVPETEPKTISFANQNCLQVLQAICSDKNFNYDFQITQSDGVKTIHIGKFGSVIAPPGGGAAFEWGKGKGIYQLKEEKVDDTAIKTRLWAEGGTTNIKSGYRDFSDRLQLPYPKRLNKNEHTLRDGTTILAKSQQIGITDDAKRYHEDATLAAMIGTDEEYKSYDEIYPKRTGSITALVDGDIYSFVDSSMDFDLNEKDADGNTKYLIGGVSAKITFISGKLAGQEFEIKDKGYDHSKKQFTIIPYQDERGQKFPTDGNAAFQFAVGNKYKLTEINPPQSALDDAEEELWYESLQDFNDMKQARVKYTLTLDRLYMINNTPTAASVVVFKVGDYVHVKDSRFGIDKNIRVTKVSRNLLLRQDYSITLSDTVTISVAAQTVIDVIEHENIIEANRLRDLTKARKAWRTTEELRNMVYDTDGYFDPENIKPNSIDTNMLTVGSKSQQFILSGVILEANKGGNANIFNATGGILSHLTIKNDGIRNWTMSEAQFTLANTNGYYVFAKCSKTGETGVWFVSQDKLLVENASDPDNYYFQVGILSAVYADDGFRDFVTTYGFTRINGNTITTGRIVTSDGENYLDLDGNKFRIGDSTSSVDWNVTAQNQLTLHNVRLLSDSGDTAPIGVYRGVYNAAYTYYYGDEVSYTSGGATKTYRYTNKTATKGVPPTNTTYWNVIAQGANGQDGQPGTDGKDGKDGDYFEYRYAVNGSTSTPPALLVTSRTPTGWSTTQPTVGALQYLWSTMAKISGSKNTLIQNWSTPVRVTPYNGVDGTNGTDGKDGADGVDGKDGVSYNPNILRSADFNDLTQWESHNGTILPDALDGVQGFYGKYDSAIDSDCTGYINLAQQLLVKTGSGGFSKINPSTWYTFSFWAKKAVQMITISVTSNKYGFAQKQCNLQAGVSYNIGVYGSISDAAKAAGKKLAVFIFDDEWTWSRSVQIDSTTNTWGYISFNDAPATGRYWIKAYLFDSTRPSGVDVGTATVAYYQIERGGQLDTYLYPSLVDTTADFIVDGINQTSHPGDGHVNWKLTTEWKKHTVTFKTKNYITGSLQHLLFRLTLMADTTYICMPKLERGTEASAFGFNDHDLKGESPVMMYRGEYDSTKTYTGSSIRVDAVKFNGVYYIARSDVGDFSGKDPTNTDYWNLFGSQFENVATTLLLAEFAYIDNLGVRNLLTATEGKRVHISQEDNSVSIYDGNGDTCIRIEGDSYTDSQLFGGSSVDVTVPSQSLSYQTGNALHPNSVFNTGKTSMKSFDFGYAGMFTGRVQFNLKFSGSYTLRSGQISRTFGATLHIYLDNTLIGSIRVDDTVKTKSTSVDISKAIANGTHKLYYMVEVSNPNYADGSHYTVEAGISFTNCKAVADMKMSRYFANGNAVGSSSTQYMESILENDILTHKVISGNAGIQISNGVMKIRIGGTWYNVSRNSSTGALTLST